LLAAFFVPLDFFGPLLRAFFAGAAVLDVAAGAAAAAVDAGAGLAALDFALPLDFDAPAAFFFGAARFFGLLALPPAAFGLAVRATKKNIQILFYYQSTNLLLPFLHLLMLSFWLL
jgi:hypothetical protein